MLVARNSAFLITEQLDRIQSMFCISGAPKHQLGLHWSTQATQPHPLLCQASFCAVSATSFGAPSLPCSFRLVHDMLCCMAVASAMAPAGPMALCCSHSRCSCVLPASPDASAMAPSSPGNHTQHTQQGAISRLKQVCLPDYALNKACVHHNCCGQPHV